MSQKIYKYNIDRKTIIFTVIHFIVFILGAILMWQLYVGGFFSAWFISLVGAIIALMALSIPRRIILDEDRLTIACILEIAQIQTKDIVSVRKVESEECRWILPICGSYGFFGYYGYYLDLQSFDRVFFYATERNNLIEIVDRFDDRYYLSSRDADQLIKELSKNVSENFWDNFAEM